MSELSSSPTGNVLGDRGLGDRIMCKVCPLEIFFQDKNHAGNCAMQLNEENRLHHAAISSNNADTLSISAAF